jgi:hypothetical protein
MVTPAPPFAFQSVLAELQNEPILSYEQLLARPLHWCALRPAESWSNDALVHDLINGNQEVRRSLNVVFDGLLPPAELALHKLIFCTCIMAVDEMHTSFPINYHIWDAWALLLQKWSRDLSRTAGLAMPHKVALTVHSKFMCNVLAAVRRVCMRPHMFNSMVRRVLHGCSHWSEIRGPVYNLAFFPDLYLPDTTSTIAFEPDVLYVSALIPVVMLEGTSTRARVATEHLVHLEEHLRVSPTEVSCVKMFNSALCIGPGKYKFYL